MKHLHRFDTRSPQSAVQTFDHNVERDVMSKLEANDTVVMQLKPDLLCCAPCLANLFGVNEGMVSTEDKA